MESKKDIKNLMLAVIGVVILCLITFGITYAYWLLTKKQTGENVINTACLRINFTGENDISLQNAYPMKPNQLENFLSKATPYHFTIENTCDDLASATINLESLNAEADKQLNDEYVNAIIYETDFHTNLTARIYNDENKVLKDSLHAYALYNFTLQKGETKSFNLLLYMDKDTPMEKVNMNATWNGKLTFSAGYKEEKLANLGGEKVPVVESNDGLYEVKHDDLEELGPEWNKAEYRYAGSNPNNFVSFNNEIWRIIGKVNVKTSSGVEQRIKIIRTNGIENQKDFEKYYWNNIYENNDWTTSSLKDMLNGIYYNSESGNCYKNEIASECDFSTGENLPKGLDINAQNMIDKSVIWNLGASEHADVTANVMYERERMRGTYANNPAEWSSATDVENKFNSIGLLYPSDYGYASGGNDRSCLNNKLNNYDNNNCEINNWLNINENYDYSWTLTNVGSDSPNAFKITYFGSIDEGDGSICYSANVWPTLYLKPTVKIISNPHSEQEYGTVDNPFQLSLSDI